MRHYEYNVPESVDIELQTALAGSFHIMWMAEYHNQCVSAIRKYVGTSDRALAVLLPFMKSSASRSVGFMKKMFDKVSPLHVSGWSFTLAELIEG